ncbi:MAG: hypothetical protein C0490_11335 [Marivirga sp.]|nr:hypothetical protein [Marivirga sp.]
MIVPPWHVDFLKQPLSFWLATASLENVPETIKCTGIRFEPETDTFTCFAPLKFAETGFKHLAENPNLALVGVELHSYEGYQYKGPFISRRDCTEEEVAFQLAYMKEFTDILHSFGYSGPGYYKAYMQSPFVAFTFQAKQVFDQSPKNGTGGELGKSKP